LVRLTPTFSRPTIDSKEKSSDQKKQRKEGGYKELQNLSKYGDLIEMKKIRARTQRFLKNKKRNGFINFGNSLHRESSIKNTWNKGNLMVFTRLPVLYLLTTTLEGTCCRAWQLPIGTQTSKKNNQPTEQKNSAWQSYIQTSGCIQPVPTWKHIT